jgi:3D (Asp-Asp-Asp) domain-containing protein
MMNPAFNLALLKRVTHVTMVALCTASTLALLGAVKPEPARARPAPKSAAVSKQAAPATPAVERIMAQIARPAETLELLIDADIAPAASAAPAPVTSRVIRMEVTAYCPCTKCCGPNAQGITASGKLVTHNGGKFVAADTSVLPFGKMLSIPGYADNQKVEVIDRGGAIKGYKLDLYFPTHAEALVWGRQQLDVTIYE